MDSQDFVEATGDNAEAAIAAGLEQLGVGPSDVMVEILDEPSRGVFGIGAKPARVRLKMLRPKAPPTSIPPAPQPAKTAAPPPPPPAAAAQTRTTNNADVDLDDVDEDDGDSDYEGIEIVDEDSLEEDPRIARQVLMELLEKMRIQGDVIVRRAEPSQPDENAPWLLDITGPDMSLLIGRRGETLNALQYIARLITSRRLQRRANIIVDAGGYKSQRSQRLRQLAKRMADQAVQQSRTIYLEPMPPNERRIIHLALRDREDVETRSTGEGDTRKVTIVPK